MSVPPTIDELRREIDAIDDAIHDLLMRRTQIVEQIGALKPRGSHAMRPGREAQILRRLAARHTGSFPVGALVRMWREMMSSVTRLQGNFAVAVYAPADQPGFWDAARDHFGGSTPMILVNTPAAALRAVTDGAATVAMVPIPSEDDKDPWWRFLMGSDEATPRVIARLPFCDRGNARGDVDALAIAPLLPEPTGDDRTLLGIELSEDVSRSRLKDVLKAAGLPPETFRSWLSDHSSWMSLHMIEIADFVDPHDPRLDTLRATLGTVASRIRTLGGYAVPIDLKPAPAAPAARTRRP